jgi:hypothetical protein
MSANTALGSRTDMTYDEAKSEAVRLLPKPRQLSKRTFFFFYRMFQLVLVLMLCLTVFITITEEKHLMVSVAKALLVAGWFICLGVTAFLGRCGPSLYYKLTKR